MTSVTSTKCLTCSEEDGVKNFHNGGSVDKHSSDIYRVCRMLRKKSMRAKNIDSSPRLPGFKYWLCCLLALWLGQVI